MIRGCLRSLFQDNEVKKGLEEAFEMAQIAVDAIEMAQVRKEGDPSDARRVDHAWDDVPPRPKELQDLIRNLFAHDDIINESQQLPDVPIDGRDGSPYKQTLKRIKLKTVYGMFHDLLVHYCLANVRYRNIERHLERDSRSWADRRSEVYRYCGFFISPTTRSVF